MTQYEQHPSSITDLACSPFQPNLFLASCLDGTARLFNVFEARPVLTLEPHASRPSRNDTSAILAAQFSPTRPCILALASDDGTIFIYDLLESETLPIAVIEIPNAAAAEGFVPGMRVSSTGLAFNPQSHGMLASCDLIGRAFVWRLGAKTAQLHGGEQLVLDQLARVQRASQF
jgi:WD40 repeat protein